MKPTGPMPVKFRRCKVGGDIATLLNESPANWSVEVRKRSGHLCIDIWIGRVRKKTFISSTPHGGARTRQNQLATVRQTLEKVIEGARA